MKKLRRPLLWLWMLSKRLFRKPVFLMLMVLIPVLVLGYSTTAREDSGVMTVLLVCEEPDELTDRIFEDLMDSSQLLQVRIAGSEKEARTLVAAGKVDAAWIFPEDLQEHIARFVEAPNSAGSFIRVVEQQDNVGLTMTREKLTGAIYAESAKLIYIDFLRELAPTLDHLTDEELLKYYRETNISSKLFDFQSDGDLEEVGGNYLLAPLRGLLAVVVVVVAQAASMYYIRDRKNGTFAWVAESMQILPELASHFVAVFLVTLTALCALLLCGLAGPILSELATLLVYCFCVCGFVMVLRRLCVSVRVLGIAMPLVVVVMFVICPVFLDLAVFRRVQLALPPTYYINAIANPAYLLYGLGYSLVCAGFCLAWDKLTSK